MTLGMNDEFEGRCFCKLSTNSFLGCLFLFQTCFPWHFIRTNEGQYEHFKCRYHFLLFYNVSVNCNTVCPTRYRTWHFFNNSNTIEDTATKFEQEHVRCVRYEKECVYSAPDCCDTEQRSASQPGSVASGTHCIIASRIIREAYGDN